MISLNNTKFEALTLVACYKECDNLSKLVCKKDGKSTLISEENKIYVYFDLKDKDQSCPQKLKCFIACFMKCNNRSLNIDVCSFKKVGGCKTLQIISEGVLYATHKEVSYKSECATAKDKSCLTNKEKLNFNLICKKKSDCNSDALRKCTMTCEEVVAEAKIKMKYVNFARDLQDYPPNICHSTTLAQKITDQAKQNSQIKIKVLDKKAIIDHKMNLIMAVNGASQHDPRVVILEYRGNPESKEIIGLIGKGVTFDTGGYNLKPSQFMKGMKFDMSGAAIASSTLMAIAEAKLKVNAVSVACIVDNTINQGSTLPESIIKSMNGKTVQIDNTDAEGRLILADGITYAIRNLKVSQLIEMSTLTGGVLVALGTKITGVFATCDSMYCQFAKAACCSGEDIWRLPFHRDFDKMITTTPIADITNAPGTRNGAANQGGAFLKQFSEDKPFIHLDIAGTATTKDQRGRGVMLRTIFNYCKIQICTKNEKNKSCEL